MGQINIRIDDQVDQVLDYLAERRSVTKTVIARELLMKNFTDQILPILLDDYAAGKIGVKRILGLTNLMYSDLMHIIASRHIDPPIPEELDEYTRRVADQLINL
jgi:hypothetical protein